MSRGINESADPSDFECFKRPKIVIQPKFRHRVLIESRTKNDLAAIKNTYDLIPRSSIGLYLEQFCRWFSRIQCKRQ